MTVHFACTGCGRCCHDLRLPLGVTEGIAWLARGGTVEIFCDATPAIVEGTESDAVRYSNTRSFTATSGSLGIEVRLMLVATFTGACPNLLPNLQCGAYETRPLACRIYPAEVRPEIEMLPSNKLCPPEAWQNSEPLFITQGGNVADPVVLADIALARAQSLADRDATAGIATLLDIDVTALANEGYAIWSPDPEPLAEALRRAVEHSDTGTTNWTFVSNSSRIRALISDAGAVAALPADVDRAMFLALDQNATGLIPE